LKNGSTEAPAGKIPDNRAGSRQFTQKNIDIAADFRFPLIIDKVNHVIIALVDMAGKTFFKILNPLSVSTSL